MSFLGRMRSLQRDVSSALEPFVLLVLRLVFGYAMFRAGWGKLNDLDQVARAFAGLDIPMPKIMAIVVAVCEAGGGLLVMAGLATRLAASVLVVIMIVALLTAHMGEAELFFSSPHKAVMAAPVPYLAMMLVFAIFGGGKLSLDHILGKGD